MLQMFLLAPAVAVRVCFVLFCLGRLAVCIFPLYIVPATRGGPAPRPSAEPKRVAATAPVLEEVIRLGLLRGYATTLLRSCLEDDKVAVQVLVQLQDGSHIAAAASE